MAISKTSTANRFAAQPRFELPGSEKQAITSEGAAPVRLFAAQGDGQPAGATTDAPKLGGRITVSVLVKPKQAIATKTLAKPEGRMSRAQFAAAHGADPAALKVVKAFAAAYGLSVDTEPGGPTTVQLTGSQSAMQKAFGVALSAHRLDDRTYRVREGAIFLPEELRGQVLAVLGLDNRPQAKAHFRRLDKIQAHGGERELHLRRCRWHSFVWISGEGRRLQGQTIGIIELGGGFRAGGHYRRTLSGLGAYGRLNVVSAVPVDKAERTLRTGRTDGADGEVMLDIEVSRGGGARVRRIAVYFAPNTDQGFIGCDFDRGA